MEIEGVSPLKKSKMPKVCTDCKTTMISAVMDMKKRASNTSWKARFVLDPVTKNRIPEGIDKENLVLMGVCTRELWDMGTRVKGCPPNNVWFVQAVVSDRMQVERRYVCGETN